MTRPHVPALACLLILLGPAGSASAQTASWPGAEPRPAGPLYLELVVNGIPSGRVVPVTRMADGFRIRASDLREAGVPVTGTGDTVVVIDELPGVRVFYLPLKQQLEVHVPAARLAAQTVSAASGRNHDEPSSSSIAGVVINYDAHTRSSPELASSSAAWLEARGFGRWGAVVTTARVHHRSDTEGRSHMSVTRHDTTWSVTSRKHLMTVAVGDVVTGAQAWTRASRVGGVSVSRNFAARPDLVTYPIPEFVGQADVPSTVDVLLNGRAVVRTTLDAGPFTILDAPVVSGAGTATVVTTDTLGRRVERSVNFYVASSLLKPGLWSYSMTVGALRRAYGGSSLDYGPPAATGVARYGLTRSVTIEAQTEALSGHLSAGLGATLGIMRAGVVAVSMSESRSDGRAGAQYTAGYEYQAPRFGVLVRHEHRSDGFTELTRAGLVSAAPNAASTRLTQVLLSLSAVRSMPVSLAYLRATTATGSVRGLMSLSVSRPLVGRARLSAAATYQRKGAGGVSAHVTLSVPMGRGTVSTGLGWDQDRRPSSRTSLNRPAPPHGGLGVDLAHATGDRDAQHASLTWRSPVVELQGGVAAAGSTGSVWASARGSVLMVGGRLSPAGRVSDAFVLVDTNGQADVPVYFENQRVGSTNRHGRLVVPGVSAYHSARVAIDPMGLSEDVRIDAIEQRVNVPRHGGAVVRFDLRRTRSVLVRLLDRSGDPFPVGRRIVHHPSSASLVVGWGSLVYVEQVAVDNVLVATNADGSVCSARFTSFSLPLRAGAVETLRCQP